MIDYRRGRSPNALADLPDGCAACVLTDPPYGTGRTDARARQYGRRQRNVERGIGIANDLDLSELAACAPEFRRVLAPEGVAMVFMGPTQYRAACDVLDGAGLEVHHSLPWFKGRPGLSYRARFAYEDIILATHPGVDPWPDRGPLVVPMRHASVNRPDHPNEKPVALLLEALRWACPSGGTVVDYFAGVASGAIAAHVAGCDWVGAECDERWWPIAERRIATVQDRPHPDAPPSLFADGAA